MNRGSYDKYTIEQRTANGKKTYECGITKYYRHEKNGSLELKESSVRTWKNAYEKELARRKRERPDDDDKDILIPQQKRGRPLGVGDHIDGEVRYYLTQLRKCGGTINTAITISSAKGIIQKYDSNLLVENGGSVHLSKSWAKYLMARSFKKKAR